MVKKGHQSGPATKSSTTTLTPTNWLLTTTTLSWNLPPIYLRRALWAGWPPLRPFSVLQGPEMVKKGHQSGPATKSSTTTLTPTNWLLTTTTLSWNLLPIYLRRALWAGWPPLRPFSVLQGPEMVKKGHQSGPATKSSTTTLTLTNCY